MNDFIRNGESPCDGPLGKLELSRLSLTPQGLHAMIAGKTLRIGHVEVSMQKPVEESPKPCEACYGSGFEINTTIPCDLCEGSGEHKQTAKEAHEARKKLGTGMIGADVYRTYEPCVDDFWYDNCVDNISGVIWSIPELELVLADMKQRHAERTGEELKSVTLSRQALRSYCSALLMSISDDLAVSGPGTESAAHHIREAAKRLMEKE